MILRSVRLYHYRNYSEIEVNFSDHINVIVGENAQGKTNLLEGLFFLSRGYSHRTAKTADLVQFDEPGFFIEAVVEQRNVRHKISVRYENRKKILTVDGKRAKRKQVLGHLYTAILFEPDDLRIVKAGPEKRRRFMNEEIAGSMPGYMASLRNYSRALQQRNALLKDLRRYPSMRSLLDGWDNQLAEFGSKIVAYRLDYLKRLNKIAKKLHSILSSGKENLSLYYQNNLIESYTDPITVKKIFRDKLKSSLESDIERGSTQFGPHVDDIVVCINGRAARKYASQGQQRTAAISLKLSQIDIYKEITGDYPVVLLDDILSELDAERQENILSILGRNQAFITCTDSGFSDYYKEKKIIPIHNGSILSSVEGSGSGYPLSRSEGDYVAEPTEIDDINAE